MVIQLQRNRVINIIVVIQINLNLKLFYYLNNKIKILNNFKNYRYKKIKLSQKN